MATGSLQASFPPFPGVRANAAVVAGGTAEVLVPFSRAGDRCDECPGFLLASTVPSVASLRGGYARAAPLRMTCGTAEEPDANPKIPSAFERAHCLFREQAKRGMDTWRSRWLDGGQVKYPGTRG